MVCGIYCIENKINNKKYIGYAINIERRWRYHTSNLRRNKHDNSFLQNAWNKYGKDNFLFSVVLKCSENELIEKEMFFIKTFQTRNPLFGYNLSAGGKGNLGSIPSEETIKRKSVSVSGKNNPMFGKNHSPETRKLFSFQRIGNKNGVGNTNNLGKLGKRKNSTSKYLGVYKLIRQYKSKTDIRWRARIGYNKKEIKIGTFLNEIDAAIAFDYICWELYRDVLKLNFPEKLHV